LLTCATVAKTGLSFNLQIILRDSVPGGVFKDVNIQRHEAATTKKNKIMKKTILLAVAVAGALTLAASAQAGEPLLSPRAQTNQIHIVASTSAIDVNLAINRPNGNNKAWEQAQSLRKVPGTGNDVDLANAPRPNMSPKNPDYQTALRNNAVNQQIQIAPLK
jgi:hypothetical protein